MRKRYFIFLLAVIMCSLFVVFGQVSTAANYFYEYEPNNNQGTAQGPVNVNTTIVGQLSYPDDYDWYVISCVAGSPLKFEFIETPYHISCLILNQNGGYLAHLGNANFPPVTVTPSYSGGLYVRVSGYPRVIDYKLKIYQ